MKKVSVLLCLVLFVTGFAAAQISAGRTLYVSVKTLTLKSGTGFFDNSNGTLKYGDRVTVIRVDGKFAEVKSAGDSSLTGWTAIANLSTRRVAPGNSDTISAQEVALAGKGFNQEVENSYNSRKKNLGYADVDKTEAITFREDDLKNFLEEGHLKMGENQ